MFIRVYTICIKVIQIELYHFWNFELGELYHLLCTVIQFGRRIEGGGLMGCIADEQERWNKEHEAAADMTEKEKAAFANGQRLLLLLAVIADNLNALIRYNGY